MWKVFLVSKSSQSGGEVLVVSHLQAGLTLVLSHDSVLDHNEHSGHIHTYTV